MLRGALASLLLLLPSAAGAADPLDRAVPAFQVHTTREGLPQNTIMALAHDRDGRVWAATQDGLASWNGRSWKVHALPDRQVSNFLRCLLVTADGAIWAGRQDGGLARFQDGRWDLVPPGALGAAKVDDLLEIDGRIWAATPTGLLRREGAVWTRVLDRPCHSLATFPGGRIAVGLDRGLAALSPDGRREEGPSLGLEQVAVNRLLRRRDGTLLAATSQGLWAWNGARWIRKPLPRSLEREEVDCLAETEGSRGATLWVGTRDGLAAEENGTWRVYGTRDGLPGRFITALLPEGRGIWIGINEGLALLQPGQWHAFTGEAGLPTPSVFCVGEALGRIWLGFREGGLARFEPDGRWRIFTRRDGLPADGVFSLHEHRGRLWAGSAGGGMAWWKDGRWTQEGVPPAFRAGTVRRLEPGQDGALWAVTGNRGIWRLDAAGWQDWRPPDRPLPARNWHSLLDAGEAGLWIGSEGAGLLQVQGGRTRVFDRSSGFPNHTVLSLLRVRRADGRPVLLAGTEGSGLLWTLLDQEPRWQVLSDGTDPELPNNTVYQIQADAAGRVYLFTNRGVARLTFGFGLAAPARVETFTTESGLPSNEFNGGASLKDSRGRIWGGTVAGAAVLDPSAELPANPLPPLILEAATAGGQRIVPGRALSYRDRPFHIEAALMAFHRAKEVRYRTQVEGLEDAPGAWTADGSRDFPSLPAGGYTLRIWARDHLGRVAGPLQLPFRVRPAPWASGWAMAGYSLAVAGLALLGARGRLRAVTRRNLELEHRIRERTRTIEEQRDHIAQLMASTSDARRDVGAWVAGAVEDLAGTLGTGPIGVYILEENGWSPLTGTHGLPLPQLAPDPSSAGSSAAGPSSNVPVRGPGGELLGALVLSPERTSETDLGILRGFAAQLGAMLELQRTQEALRQSRIQRARAHQVIAERGTVLVQVCPACSRCYGAGFETCVEDGAALASPHLLPYRIQERYQLDRLLGEGGMGLVFRARDLRLDRDVAVKVLKTDATGPDGPARFRQEAHALAAIHHPGVVAIYDSGELDQGSAFLVTELLEGRPLNELLRAHGRGAFAQVARLLRQAGAALGAAHGAGLLHRDLKPANLYLVPTHGGFQAKLIDFGLAKPLRSDAHMTQTGRVIGTPNYMSPEQVRGLELDARSDVWAFAALAFEALTGHRLIDTANVGEAFLAITQGRYPTPSRYLAELPLAVDRAFLQGLHLEPAARPWNVEVWVNSFAKYLESMPDRIPGWPIDPAAKVPDPDPPTRGMPQVMDENGRRRRT